jgi:hypothetical protein
LGWGLFLSLSILSTEAAAVGGRSARAQVDTCGEVQLDKLRAAAQALDPATEALAARLAKCEERQDEIQLWTAYYHYMRGEYAKNANTLKVESGALDERMQLLAAASQGSYRRLQEMIERQAPGYAGDAESLLVLARALARDRRFDEADRRYRQYGQLKPDDVDVEIERAYARVWAEDVHGAIEAFEALLAREKIDERSRRALTEARDFATARALNLHEREAFVATSVTGGPTWAWTSYRNFSRTSLGTSWLRQDLTLSFDLHRLLSDEASLVGYEGTIARTFRLPLGMELYGRGGFFYANAGVPLLTLVLTRPFVDGPTPLLGLEQDAVARSAALPAALAGTTRRSLFIGVRYKRVLDYRFSHGWMGAAGDYDKHVGLVRVRVFQSRGGRALAAVVGRFENESHDVASPYLYTPKSATLIRPGVEVAGAPAGRTHARLEGGFGMVREVRNPSEGKTLTLGAQATVLGLAGEVWTELSCRFSGVLSLRGDWTFDAGGKTTYSSGAILGGIAIYQDRCDARGVAR